MALGVNTNVASLAVQKNLGKASDAMSTSMTRLSSGLRTGSPSAELASTAQTATTQAAATPSAIVRISPEAMALSRSAESLNASAAVAGTAAQTSLQAIQPTPASTNTSSSGSAAYLQLQGMGTTARSSSGDVQSSTNITLSAAAVNQVDSAATVADRATETASTTASMARNQILNYAGQAVMAQANALPQMAARLLG